MSNRKIVAAYQKGNSVTVEVKSPNGGASFSRIGELVSFSENMVCVKHGTSVKTFDADNHETSSHYAG